MVGTNGYCAPELLREEPYYGIKNDIFSLGVTLFVIIFGRKPFNEASENNYLYGKIIANDFNTFWEKVQNGIKMQISNDLKNLLNNMLCHDHSKRYGIVEIRNHPWVTNYKQNNEYFSEFEKRFKLVERKKEIERKKINNCKHFKVCLQKYKSEEIHPSISHKLKLKKYKDNKNKYEVYITGECNPDRLFQEVIGIFKKMENDFLIKPSDKSFSMKINSEHLKFKVSIKRQNDTFVVEFKKRLGDRFTLHKIFEDFIDKINICL
jgi:serine/threonine protein kinase